AVVWKRPLRHTDAALQLSAGWRRLWGRSWGWWSCRCRLHDGWSDRRRCRRWWRTALVALWHAKCQQAGRTQSPAAAEPPDTADPLKRGHEHASTGLAREPDGPLPQSHDADRRRRAARSRRERHLRSAVAEFLRPIRQLQAVNRWRLQLSEV